MTSKSTVAESDAVIALDVDGEQVTVFKCAICDQLFPTLPLLEVSTVCTQRVPVASQNGPRST